MVDNPYSTPIGQQNTDATGEMGQAPATLVAIAKRTFLAWEKLRIAYIAILGVYTLLLVARDLGNLEILLFVAGGAITANICYFAGPVIETYVRWLGYDRTWIRWLMFIGGLLLTMVLAFAGLTAIFLANEG